ncbi:hypothetical protein [Luteirhabdus pelagi]|uniref:hypothetical protein n=1 Tax=Luteirhabdus pelagi TaxID=2792783 RepID=UPI0019393D75|nr:hypothetical protein [Luteirhabdus pelagi]
MTATHTILECEMKYKDGSATVNRLPLEQLSIGLKAINETSVRHYLTEQLENVEEVRITDVRSFKDETEYVSYIRSVAV